MHWWIMESEVNPDSGGGGGDHLILAGNISAAGVPPQIDPKAEETSTEPRKPVW